MNAGAVRWLLVVLGLAACERRDAPRQPILWRTPHVGDHGSGSTHYTATLRGADGREVRIDNYSEYTSESLELDGDYVVRIRMTFVRDDRKVDGVVQPGVSGTYEVAEHPDGTLAIIRTDGPETEEAKRMIGDSHHQTRKTNAAAKQLMQRTFKEGDSFDLTPDEVAGLGFGMSHVRLTAREVAPSHISFQMDNVAELAGVGTLKATGTLRITATGRDLQQDGEVLAGTKQVGTFQIVQHASYQLR